MNEYLISSLIEWVKSSQTDLTDTLQELVESYFEWCSANKCHTTEDKQDRRIIVAKKLVVNCIYALDKAETKKLEKALISIANKI